MNNKKEKNRIITGLISGILITFFLASCGKDGELRGTYTEDDIASASAEHKEDTDTDPADNSEEEVPSEEAGEEISGEAGSDEPYEPGDLVFNTTDIYGKKVTDEVIKGSKLVLMNLWEPWCGPCVNEMPDLERLYEKYKDEGLLILGVYSSFDYDREAKEVIDQCGITYPVIKADAELLGYEQNYVPATFLFDGKGNLVEREPVEGSRSYDDWEAIITHYLSR